MIDFSKTPEATAFRQHSQREAARTDVDAFAEYSQKLTEALEWPGLNPIPHPFTRNCDEVAAWIDPSTVKVHETTLYHHKEDQLLVFAVVNRGNADRHLRDMADLWVTRYPTPVGCQDLHAVTTNGHHRRLVFHLIGHTLVGARVQGSAPDRWTISIQQTRWLPQFERLGLAWLEDSGDRRYPTLVDPKGLAGWVLPPSKTPMSKIPSEIHRRMLLLERAVGKIQDPEVAFLRDLDEVRKRFGLRRTLLGNLPRWLAK